MGNMQVIKASAGSGKTYTLAKRYLEEMLFVNHGGTLELRGQKDYFEHIMAITFTNKATNEMKKRIIDELYKLAKDVNNSDFYKNEWKNKCSQEALDGLQQAAKNCLACILFRYSDFKVSTIDSFFQSVLRNFARELDRDYNYDLTLDGDYAAAVAAHKFLLSLGHDVERTGKKNTTVIQWVKNFISDNVNDNKSWNSIFGTSDYSLAKFAAKINNEFFREHMPALRQYLTGDTEGKGLEKITRLTALLKKKAEEYEEEYSNTEERKNKFHALCDEIGLSEDCFHGSRLLDKLYKDGTCTDSALRDNSEKCKTTIFKKFYPSEDQNNKLCTFFRSIIFSHDCAELLNDIVKKLSFVGLIGELNKKLEEYREETNTVLIADTNELIGKVVDSSPAPFIYERIGTWINHYMLDEFQDTSSKQYSNFKPLLKESLDSGNANLIIGDAKQSIYRFRNADPKLFRDTIDVDFKRYLDKHTLDTNWRSHKSIIDFNNEFIGHFLNYLGYSKLEKLEQTYMPDGAGEQGYKQKISGPKSNKPAGLVRVKFGYKGTDEENPDNTFPKVENVVPVLIEDLKEMHKRFAWSDINILVNKKKDGEVVVSSILDHNKQHPDDMIPIVSGELMRLDQSTAVRRIVSMLEFIDLTSFSLREDNDDPTEVDKDIKAMANKRRMKQQRQFRVFEMFVERLIHNENIMPDEAGQVLEECFAEVDQIAQKDQTEQMKMYAQNLNDRLPDQRTQTMSLVNIVETLIKKSIKADEREKENIFLQAFLNCIVDFASKRNGGTVREFLAYWEQHKEKLTVPDSGDSDAIKVYTIHASKGLEADCVVIPCANWELDNNKMDKDYWIDGKDWLNHGGSDFLDKIFTEGWDRNLIPPILSVSKSKLRAMKTHGYFEDICNSQDEDLLIDNVNKTYVAFTRPRKELHIYSVSGPKGGTSINHILEDVIRNKMSGFHTDDQFQYDLGEPYTGGKDPGSKEEDEKYTNLPMPVYFVSEKQVEVSLPDDNESARQIGKRLHLLLSRINYCNQLEKALSYCERRGIISSADEKWNTQYLRKFLSEKLQSEPFASWFALDNKVYNERPLLVQVDGNKEFRRPDRIVKRPDGTYIVVDYKFGNRSDETDKRYTRQVKRYTDALARTTEAPVKGYVWYVTEDAIIDVK